MESEAKVSWTTSFAIFIVELIRIMVISLAIIIPVRYFFIQPFYVKGASMQPNFYNNEYLVIDEISYRFKEPIRGEIVVFKNPLDPKKYFIKRIIGLPNEKVEIEDGNVLVNGVKLDETEYLGLGTRTGKKKYASWILKADEYFVMGDNRAYSLDSRNIGPIKDDLIIGKVWVRGWPFDKISFFEPPIYEIDKNNQ